MITAANSPIRLNLHWSGPEAPTHMYWLSDDGQGEMDGGPIDPDHPIEPQMVAIAQEMMANGCDGSGQIGLT